MQVEIHITTQGINNAEVDRFINFCNDINAKPIVIELPVGEVLQHPMISKRVEANNQLELNNIVFDLKNKFLAANYTISRVKLEVDSKNVEEGKLFFPEFKGGYYEWHAKVYHDDLKEIYRFAKMANVHVSKNGLKGIENRRILTIRETERASQFHNKIKNVKYHFQRNGVEIVNEEHEYCIFDSNKMLDKGWIETPEITDQNYLDMLSFEAFLRRAATLDLPFMLKGSILTRQFYSNKKDRIVRDIDYLFFGEVKDDVEFMSSELSNWVEAVTSLSMDDNVSYRPFSENRFWRAIDYAMNDDFPTTNTDLFCTVGNTVNPIVGLDVSWGLPLHVEPVSMLYYPLEGEPFEIPYTTPISLQLSWKLHQCIVRPRLKDIIDICYLLKDVDPSRAEIKIAITEYILECQKDEIDSKKLLCFIDGSIRAFLQEEENLLSRILGTKRIEPPLSNMGELENDDIDFLRYTFPNYHLKYSTITDVLIEFEELLKKYDFGKLLSIIQKNNLGN